MESKAITRLCKHCNNPVDCSSERGQRKLYCSRLCRIRAEHKRQVDKAKYMPCNECGAEFKALQKTSKFCCRSCAIRFNNKLRSVKVNNDCDINKMIFSFGVNSK